MPGPHITIDRVTKLLANIYSNSTVGYVGLATPCMSYIMHGVRSGW